MNILRTKSIEDIENKTKCTTNISNKNPYIRRYGSHKKSHFSQSKCELFDSDEEQLDKDKKMPKKPIINKFGSIDLEHGRKTSESNNNSSLQNLDGSHQLLAKRNLYGGRSNSHVKNNPSIGNNNLESDWIKNDCGYKLGIENKIQLEGDEDEDDIQNISNRKYNVMKDDIVNNVFNVSQNQSLKNIEFDTSNLAEPGTECKFNQKSQKIDIEEEKDFLAEKGFSLTSTANNSIIKEIAEENGKDDQIQIETDEIVSDSLDIEKP